MEQKRRTQKMRKLEEAVVAVVSERERKRKRHTESSLSAISEADQEELTAGDGNPVLV